MLRVIEVRVRDVYREVWQAHCCASEAVMNLGLHITRVLAVATLSANCMASAEPTQAKTPEAAAGRAAEAVAGGTAQAPSTTECAATALATRARQAFRKAVACANDDSVGALLLLDAAFADGSAALRLLRRTPAATTSPGASATSAASVRKDLRNIAGLRVRMTNALMDAQETTAAAREADAILGGTEFVRLAEGLRHAEAPQGQPKVEVVEPPRQTTPKAGTFTDAQVARMLQYRRTYQGMTELPRMPSFISGVQDCRGNTQFVEYVPVAVSHGFGYRTQYVPMPLGVSLSAPSRGACNQAQGISGRVSGGTPSGSVSFQATVRK